MTAVTTDPNRLPQYAGQPVPWVTRWTGEVNQDLLSVAHTRDGLILHYKAGPEFRDDHNLLWKREGITRSGRPQFSEMNAYRQRASMRKRLCQICGSKIQDRPIRWLMSPWQLHADDDEGALIMSPPTCASCIPLALDLCPHLRQEGYVILKVLDYSIWGVMGHGVLLDEEGKIREAKGVYVSYDDPERQPLALHAMAGYQQVVRLEKFVIEEESHGGPGRVAEVGAGASTEDVRQ